MRRALLLCALALGVLGLAGPYRAPSISLYDLVITLRTELGINPVPAEKVTDKVLWALGYTTRQIESYMEVKPTSVKDVLSLKHWSARSLLPLVLFFQFPDEENLKAVRISLPTWWR